MPTRVFFSAAQTYLSKSSMFVIAKLLEKLTYRCRVPNRNRDVTAIILDENQQLKTAAPVRFYCNRNCAIPKLRFHTPIRTI